jgi:predicted LPLAT superfamily acyltransferase
MTRPHAPRWSSKSLGSKAGHCFFNLLVKTGGVLPAYAILFPVVFWYTLLPSVRARSRPYLRRRFPQYGTFRLWLACLRLNLSFGMVLLDRMIFRILKRGTLLSQEWDDRQIRELLEPGKGLIVLSCHVGAWQTGIAGLSVAGVPINVVLLQEQGNFDTHFFETGSSGPAVNIINPASPFGGMIDMLRALRRNEIVCVMGDRYLLADSNVLNVSLLGDDIPVPIFPYAVASASGAPVSVMATFREGPCTVRAHVLDSFRVPPEVGKKQEACLPYAQRFAGTMERLALLCPYQFFNFYDMWKK